MKLKIYFSAILILFSLLSCLHNIPPRHYKSFDQATGGFNDFSLDLNPNGELKLSIETSLPIDQNDQGTTYEKRLIVITGKWQMKNERVDYSLDQPKSFLDSIFQKSEFKNLSKKPIVKFTEKLDTAYIYGIPCVLTK